MADGSANPGGPPNSGAEPDQEPAPTSEAGDLIELGHGITVPVGELSWRYSASGGPGGQHVNTANTKVEVRFDVAGSPSLPEWARSRLLTRLGPRVSVTASDRRSQLRNRELALKRLTERLAGGLHRDPPRRATRPSKAAQRRRVEAKRRHGDQKRQRRSGPADED